MEVLLRRRLLRADIQDPEEYLYSYTDNDEAEAPPKAKAEKRGRWARSVSIESGDDIFAPDISRNAPI